MGVLEYQSARAAQPGAQMMFWLTFYFFGGFVALMFTLFCVAFLWIFDDLGGRLLWSIISSIGATITARCAQMVWKILSSDSYGEGPSDQRLHD